MDDYRNSPTIKFCADLRVGPWENQAGGDGEILTSTKNKVAILNSLGFTGIPPPKNHKIYSFLHN